MNVQVFPEGDAVCFRVWDVLCPTLVGEFMPCFVGIV